MRKVFDKKVPKSTISSRMLARHGWHRSPPSESILVLTLPLRKNLKKLPALVQEEVKCQARARVERCG